MTATFTHQRLATDGLSTISRLFAPDGAALCWLLEDGFDTKDNPCIPAGEYRLRLRTWGGWHDALLKKYGSHFHKGMVELVGVKDRSEILFHTGNTIIDTKGCPLSGSDKVEPPGRGSGHWEVLRSGAAYQLVYPKLRDAILAGPVSWLVKPVEVPK